MKKDIGQLKQMQSLNLEQKIRLALRRIEDWYNHWDGEVYVAFSGGKDSTVLLDIIRTKYPHVEGVFIDTGFEYPEIREFVKSTESVVTIRPKLSFLKVIKKHGYPVISKKTAQALRHLQNPSPKNAVVRRSYMEGITGDGRETRYKLALKWRYLIDAPFKISEKCCDVMKKEPAFRFQKESGKNPHVGTMADDSMYRETHYLNYGCNIYDSAHPVSRPISFFLENDILQYLVEKQVPYSPIYGDIVKNNFGQYKTTGEKRTGCMYCMFGIHLDETPNRFQRMALTHPKQYKYCINKLGLGDVLTYIDIDYKPIKPQKQIGDYE